MTDYIKVTGYKSELYKRVEKNYGITEESIKRFNLKISDPKLLIYQLYWQQSQKEFLDPKMMPIMNFEPDRKINPFQENNDIIQIYYNGYWQKADLIGILSWRFFEKTGLKYNDILKEIDSEYDVYSLSPKSYAKVGHHYQNKSYPTILQICKFIDSKNILPVKTFGFNEAQSYCNYWLLSPQNFKEYVENYLIPVINEFKMGVEAKELLKLTLPHRGELYNSVVFFLEGLFSLFLSTKIFKYIQK